MQVPLNDLSREMLELGPVIQGKIAQVMSRGWFLMGEELVNFESEFAKYLGVSHFVGLANGTDALEIALRCIDIGPNDKVIVAPNAAMYGTIGVLNCGAQPIFVDIDETLCMSAKSFKELAKKGSCKAVIVTHLYGQMADIESICQIAEEYGIKVIEDCAQAHGARRNGRMAGAFGDIATFSFYPTKNLGAMGDGGGLACNSDHYQEKARILRQYGWKNKKYYVDFPNGRNSRLDEIQAACLRVKLGKLNGRNERRRAIWNHYRNELKGRIPFIGRNDESFVAHLCVVLSQNRDFLKDELKKRGVATEIHYPVPDFRQKIFDGLLFETFYPNADKACQSVLTLPCFPEMTDFEVELVTQSLLGLV